MSKIYIVTEGHYEDYHIIAATTNKDIANAICKMHKEDHTSAAIVEEYDDCEDTTLIEKSAKYQYVEYKIFIDDNNNAKQIIFEGFTDEIKEPEIIYSASNVFSMWIKCTLNGDKDSEENREKAIRIAKMSRSSFLQEQFRLRYIV